MNGPTNEPFEFSLVINDVKLDADTVERVGKKLSDLILSELAGLDIAGELVAEPLPTARDFGPGGSGGVAGRFFTVT